MPTNKLSTDTARLIGSAASITSPCAVVKELLDNAIDAGASAVEIALAPNTLDTIRVRDNGRGIPLNDLIKLGRPAHTSKLAAFAELTSGRVQTLGFRGQAMASICTAAVAVTVISKTADEPVATKRQISVHGGGNGTPVSAPTGTTVQVNGLFGNMPPRKQFLLKESKKNMSRVKELLMAYVLASADLRIVLKVWGEEKQVAKYGYTRERDLKQSVLEVFGATVAANGETHRFANADALENTFTLMAFLPNVKSDLKIMAGKGAYISVNGRPICSTLGIGKALTSVFKTQMQKNWEARGLAVVHKPLFLLEISCSFASYDANVATMKDDVLFAESKILLKAFEDLCSTIYDKIDISENGGKNIVRCENSEMRTGASMTPPPEKLIAAQMRMACSVNMLRTNSNTTDEETDFQTVEVEIPKRRETTDGKLGASSGAVKGLISKSLRGIEQYFQPKGADFEIATDDTATPPQKVAELGRVLSSPASCPAVRMPLQDVPDSTLNILANISDSASDISSQGGAPRLSALNGTTWSIQSLINRNLLQAPSRGSTSASPPPQLSVPLTRGRQQDRQQVLQRARLPILRTPPPSDPTREEARFVPASHVLGADIRREPSPASSYSSESSVEAGQTRNRTQQQPRVERRALPRAGSGESRVRTAASGATGPGRGMAARARQQVTERPLARRQEYEDSRDAASSETELVSSQTVDYGDVTKQRLLQAAPIYRETDVMQSDAGTPPQPKRQCVGNGRFALTHQPKSVGNTPLVRENVENLPLESIPQSMATWRSVLTTDVGFSDVRILMSLERTLDMYIMNGSFEFSLKDLTRCEVAELEARTRRLCAV